MQTRHPLLIVSISLLFITAIFGQNRSTLELESVLDQSYEYGTVHNYFVNENSFERSGTEEVFRNTGNFETETLTLNNHPNPSINYTVVSLPKITTQVNITVTDRYEKIVLQDVFQTINDGQSVYLEIENLPSGYYIYTVIDEQNGNAYQGRVFRK